MAVISTQGQIITDTSASQFSGFYHGKPVKVLSIAQDQGPRRVFILLDASGSMQSTRTLDFDVADALLDRLPSNTQVGAMVFAKETVGAPEFTLDRDSIRKQLQSLRDDKRLPKAIKNVTALHAAIQDTMQAFGSPQDGDTLYIISDGEDNASRLDWRDLDDQLHERGIRVFAMLVHWTGEMGSDSHLQDFVSSTGGFSIILPLDFVRYENHQYDKPLRDPAGKPTRLARQIDLQVQLIMYPAKMRIQLPETSDKKRNLELRFSQPNLSKDRILIYQHTLSPCPASFAAK